MADQLYLSYWLRGRQGLRNRFLTLARLFPFSALSKGMTTLTIHAVSEHEPPIFERAFPNPPDLEEIFAVIKDFPGDDHAYLIDAWWDLWQFHDDDWMLYPSRVILSWLGPEFENETGEQLRIELGVDANFLPQPDMPGSATFIEKNVRSLIRLTHEMDERLSAERRQLWTESGDNFADRLREALTEE
jgi:hypothetical protein